jgi:hypothetical protein
MPASRWCQRSMHAFNHIFSLLKKDDPATNKIFERWISRKPADVTVRRIPAVLRENWAPHARVFYTLEALSEVERLHQRAYYSYHVEELAMSRPEAMSDWAVRNGIARERWDEANSPVASKLADLPTYHRHPVAVVDGRYHFGNMSKPGRPAQYAHFGSGPSAERMPQ